jgi:hypothetical protein
MRSILEAGPRNDVGDNLFLTSAAAYKKILQMKEVPFGGASGKSGFAAGIEISRLLSKI